MKTNSFQKHICNHVTQSSQSQILLINCLQIHNEEQYKTPIKLNNQ